MDTARMAPSCSSLILSTRSFHYDASCQHGGYRSSASFLPAQTRCRRSSTARQCSPHTNGAFPRFQDLVSTENRHESVGTSMTAHATVTKEGCYRCAQKGAIQCLTCTGSGLYVDAILESQGIIVRVRCLGCGGSGEIMCPKCGGRGHI